MSHAPEQPFALRVDGVSKAFRLPHEQVHTLKERALHPFKRRTHDRLDALRDVSFDVAPGEFFGIVGRNGSGKSTLLKCLAGIYRPDGGEILVNGRLAPFIELGVGFNPDLTARDNVIINAIMLGLSPAQARARYRSIIEYAELEEFEDLKLKNYSSGMQVRLGFAVMVQVDADVLLIDEVLAVGDAAFQQRCHDTLREMRGQGRTILLVTHDMFSVEQFCDRAMLLERGEIVAVGPPRTIARRYNEINFADVRSEAARPTAGTGDGRAVLLDVWAEDAGGNRAATLESGTPCTLAVLVEFRAAVENPMLGLSVEDAARRRVFATATEWQGVLSGRYEAGDVVQLRVAMECILGGGRYFISPFVAQHGGGRYMDIREGMATVMVASERNVSAVVELPHQLCVERSPAGAQPSAASGATA